MYDFIVYGFYATAFIAPTFFPSDDVYLSKMAALLTFGVGFLMRPLGALVLGPYIDRHGRRRGLMVTLGLMAAGTVLIAFTPSYASIGIAAPLIVVFGRLLQGFSAGVELGGVSVYLSEIAPPGKKGFYVSFQSGSQQVGCGLCSASRQHSGSEPEQGRYGVVGLACAVHGWMSDRPGAVLHPALARRNGSLSGSQAPSVNLGNPGVDAQELVDRGAWHLTGDHDHGVVLHDHGVHADLRTRTSCTSTTSMC